GMHRVRVRRVPARIPAEVRIIELTPELELGELAGYRDLAHQRLGETEFRHRVEALARCRGPLLDEPVVGAADIQDERGGERAYPVERDVVIDALERKLAALAGSEHRVVVAHLRPVVG